MTATRLSKQAGRGRHLPSTRRDDLKLSHDLSSEAGAALGDPPERLTRLASLEAAPLPLPLQTSDHPARLGSRIEGLGLGGIKDGPQGAGNWSGSEGGGEVEDPGGERLMTLAS